MKKFDNLSPVERSVVKRIRSNKEELIQLTKQLIRVPSLNRNEAKIQKQILEIYEAMGLKVDLWYPKKSEFGRYSRYLERIENFDQSPQVVGVAKSTGKGKSIILNGHCDVVTPGIEEKWADSPWSGRVSNGRIFGRGSADMKAGLSAQAFALKAILESDISLNGDVNLESVSYEEVPGLVGSLSCFLRGYTADAAIISEPTELSIITSKMGTLMFRVKLYGKSAHGAASWRGTNVIETFGRLFKQLRKYERIRNQECKTSMFMEHKNRVSLNVSYVHSDSGWVGRVPDELVMEGRVGYYPGEDYEIQKRRFEAFVVKELKNLGRPLEKEPELHWIGSAQEPVSEVKNKPVANLVSSAYQSILGRKPKIGAVVYGSDMHILANYAKIPTVIFGPGSISSAHMVNESVSISEVAKASEIIALSVIRWCGVS